MDWTALLKLAASAVAKYIGGPLAWVYEKIMIYGGQALLDLAQDWVRKLKRQNEQDKAKKEFEKVINNPDSTVEERAAEYEKYMSSGRK